MFLSSSLRASSRRLQSILKARGRSLHSPPLSLARLLSCSSIRSAVTVADLEKAKERIFALPEDPGTDDKLKLYALYKQVSQ